MAYDHDVCVIGLGPAGMAVSIMASEMGLRVLGIEKRSLGGECMSVGCIPSKALLRMGHARHLFKRLETLALEGGAVPEPAKPFQKIAEHIQYIHDKKTTAMFAKVDLKLREGAASFVNPHTVDVAGSRYTAKRIFICTGTKPCVPPIPGIDKVEFLTNENLFSLDEIPQSMVIIGGGAIGSEMAQAFGRLGCKATIVHADPYLLPRGEPGAGQLLEKVFADEGIEVYNGRTISNVSRENGQIVVETDRSERLCGEKLLVAAGRDHDFTELRLENAGVDYDKGGIKINKCLRTSQPHIYAPGDCNGSFLFTHAAMHQGMIALMNAMMPWPFGLDYRKYAVPWTVFTEPQVAHVGMLERDLKANGISYEIIEERYEDYGAAIAEGIAIGSVRAYASKTGRIYGARIIGEGAGEMIGEWGLAIQNRLRIHKIMFLQHSFPTMSFLTKRVSEGWMMNRMKSRLLRRLIRFVF
jgi:pyruvate/2-oxoglutarate dehydrogenase complex dihydrolipoamide dehydrogenase (E3) component